MGIRVAALSGAIRLAGTAGGPLLAGCQLPQLASPEVGSCSDAIGANRWPKFDGTGGVAPTFTMDEVGWDQGLVPPDFELLDQFGDPTCLWQMIGHYVVLDVSALWCGPCQELAQVQACAAEAYDGNVIFLTLMTQDFSGGPADLSHAQKWSSAFGLDTSLTPVIADGGQVVSSGFSNPQTASLPTLLLLDDGLRWLHRTDNGILGDAEIQAILEERLGLSAAECHEATKTY